VLDRQPESEPELDGVVRSAEPRAERTESHPGERGRDQVPPTEIAPRSRATHRDRARIGTH
jgi:hypothetical protein